MSSPFLLCISITLLVLTLTVESVYNPYLYDDGKDGEEHCCLVRVRENFCWATPITRRLVQVNQQCGQSDRPKHRRFGKHKENKEYLDKISRRLNVQTVQEIGDKILIELQKPLEQHILKNDLICLTSTNNNINLEKCHVELVDESDDDIDDDHMSRRERRRRRKHRGDHRHFDHKKRSAVKTNEEEDTAVDDDDDDTKSKENEAENEIRRIELAHPVRIREGHGLSIRQKHKIHPSPIRPKNRQQRQCLSWYRRLTRKIERNPTKHLKSCVSLHDRYEKCINQLIHNTFNNTEEEQQQHKKISFSLGSKLYCENNVGYNKLLGLYEHSELCFYPQNQIYIEHEFTDIASLSDMQKNQDTLDFIVDQPKLNAEFEDDCHEKTNLVEISEPEKKHKPKQG